MLTLVTAASIAGLRCQLRPRLVTGDLVLTTSTSGDIAEHFDEEGRISLEPGLFSSLTTRGSSV